MCIYSYMFELQSPSKCYPFDAIHLSRHFFHCSKQFLNSLILMPFSASAIFCFTSFTLAKHFPLGPFFIWGSKNKSLGARLGEQGGWDTGIMLFLVKNYWTLSVVWTGVLINYPSWNGQMHCKSSKKFTHAKRSLSQQRQLVHWYRWVSRTLT